MTTTKYAWETRTPVHELADVELLDLSLSCGCLLSFVRRAVCVVAPDLHEARAAAFAAPCAHRTAQPVLVSFEWSRR